MNANSSRYQLMKYNRSGKSGLMLPLISLGMWHNFGTNDDINNMKQMCFTAFDSGITHFDLANNYGPLSGSAETNMGKILAEEFANYRDELIISTKAGYTMWEGPYGDFGSRKYLLSSLNQSLKRLKLDYVDIFYHHRMDMDTPLEESMSALDTAVKSGKALYAGISNYNATRTAEAIKILKDLKCPFVINQIRYSMFDRHIETDGLKQFAHDNGCGLIAFSPLAQGLLSDKYLHGVPKESRIAKDGRFLSEKNLTEQRLKQIFMLNQVAIDRGQTLAQLALTWVLKDKDITSVLIGASSPAQIKENLQIVNAPNLSQEELTKIDTILSIEL